MISHGRKPCKAVALTKGVGIYLRTRDEKNLPEFIEYYLKIGVSSFVIHDDRSEPPVSDVIEKMNIDNSKFTVLRNLLSASELNCPVKFTEAILPHLKENMGYCLYVDADEYLYLGDGIEDICDLVEKYCPFDQLQINWLYFGSNGLTTSTGTTLLDKFTKCAPRLNNHVKSLFKVSSVVAVRSPHYASLKPGSINKNVLNHVCEVAPTNSIGGTTSGSIEGDSKFGIPNIYHISDSIKGSLSMHRSQ